MLKTAYKDIKKKAEDADARCMKQEIKIKEINEALDKKVQHSIGKRIYTVAEGKCTA